MQFLPDQEEWLTPQQAASLMSEIAGYQITPDDLKQMRTRGKITQRKDINEHISLYAKSEIETVTPPKKRHPQPVLSNSEKDAEIGLSTS